MLDAQLPEWGPCAGGKNGEGRGDPPLLIVQGILLGGSGSFLYAKRIRCDFLSFSLSICINMMYHIICA